MVLIRVNKNAGAFTLIEILAALAIIVILVSLLVPALNMAHNAALVAKEKAHLNSIGVALEAFKNDFGDYPDSTSTDDVPGEGPPDDFWPIAYCGAQKLAEAIIGRDGLGFHPDSVFAGDGLDSGGNPLYHPDINPPTLTEAQITANHSARKGPYLELEVANAVKVNHIYTANNLSSRAPSLKANTYVLADVFGKVKNNATGGRTGLPILYYKANINKFLHDPTNVESGGTGWSDNSNADNNDIYNYADNMVFARLLYVPWDPTRPHPMAKIDPPADNLFYKMTANPNFTNPAMPYRAQSFILISAGADGLYGTGDDVFNFDK